MYGAEAGKPSFGATAVGRRLVGAACGLWRSSTKRGSAGNLCMTFEITVQHRPACAALVKDLQQRGLLDDTLVIWAASFGRTRCAGGGNDGRDHHHERVHDVARRRRRQAGITRERETSASP